MAQEQKLSELTAQRGFVRGKVTRLYGKLLAEHDDWGKTDLSLNILKAQNLLTEIKELDDKILSICIALKKDQSELEQRSEDDENYMDKLLLVISQCENANTDSKSSVNISGASAQPLTFSQKIKLPTIELPKFGNKKGENLAKFLKNLDTILSDSSLKPYQKFLYLKKQLYDAPLTVIESFTVTDYDSCYDEAKKLLSEAFDSAEKSKRATINALSELKLNYNEQPYNYIASVRTIQDEIKSQNLNVDDFIRHFIWNGFNKQMQTHLTQITNKCTPTLDEINKNLFEAADRYTKQISENKPRGAAPPKTSDTIVQATNIQTNKPHNKSFSGDKNKFPNDSKKVFCLLCAADKKPKDHLMKNCPAYKTPKGKFDQLRKIKACTKCGFNHPTSECKFIFRNPCRFCTGGGGNHFSYLCTKAPNPTAANPAALEPDDGNVSIASSVAYVEATQLTVSTNNILPTFTGYLGDQGSSYPARIFRDCGCQSTLICGQLAESLGLPVVQQDLSLKIYGINTSKIIKTNVVKINLRIGETTFEHNAICIPEIRTRFKVDGVGKIVSDFKTKGYRVADTAYDSETTGFVENIDIILGTDADHMLQMSYRNFGDNSNPNTMATFIDTPIGVIFSGNIDKMMRNIRFLPDVSERSSNMQDADGVRNFSDLAVSTANIVKIPNELDCSIEEGFSHPPIEISSNKCLTEILGRDDDFSFDQSTTVIGDDYLDDACKNTLNICNHVDDPTETDTNVNLTDFVLENTTYDENNRLKMPLLWNPKNQHLLAKNYNLASKVLESNLRKLQKDENKLKMYDAVIREQVDLGIVQRINCLDNFLLEHPEASFLCHQGIFKMSRESTKCRVVFMSNMHEKFKNGISHNMAILGGPNICSKISTAVILNRFNKFMLIFDIQKAFLSISLYEEDQSRLCFLWFQDVEKNNFNVVGYKNLRLSFGLRCSPAILMLGLYKILIMDSSGDERIDQIKREVYNCLYMDNGSFTCNDRSEILEALDVIKGVLEPHKLFLQQFGTNDMEIQSIIDQINNTETADNTKFFGMNWQRSTDTFSPVKISLNSEANTKRKILSAINSVYDIFGLYSPVLLRAKLFLQNLLSTPALAWDAELSVELLKEWRSICKQANSVPQACIPRSVGSRNSEYSLIALVDASKDAYGIILYIKDLNTQAVSYLTARNRLVNTASAKKTIPTLELQAIAFGVENLKEMKLALCGPEVVIPIQINSCYLFTDSMVCLHWLIKNSVLFEKMQSSSVFVKNRLSYIEDACNDCPITFKHIPGTENTADLVTRVTTPKSLAKSLYYTGPDILRSNLDEVPCDMVVSLPDPRCKINTNMSSTIGCVELEASAVFPPGGEDFSPPKIGHLIPLNRYSSMKFLINVMANVLKFVDILKSRVKNKSNPNSAEASPTPNYHVKAWNTILSTEQQLRFPEVFDYLKSPQKHLKNIPDAINRFNLYRDEKGLLRVRSKFQKDERVNPIFISSDGPLAPLIIQDIHEKLGHLGIHSVIRELYKTLWITKCWSTVKRTLKDCISCRRIHERPVLLNQNSYKDFRSSPPRQCFKSIMIDHLGPFTVNFNGKREKVWILVITCLFSRAVNLKVCRSLSVGEFLKAIQLHCFEFGMFEEWLSDMGSQIQAGAHILKAFLSDAETRKFLSSNGIKEVKFQHRPKGNSSLSSLVEICCKMVKQFLQKSIRNNVLDYFDFTFLISKAVHLINKRPVAFRESLRALPSDQVPTCVTPEMLLRGFETATVNLIPQLQTVEDDFNPNIPSVASTYEQLSRVRRNLIDLYHSDFVTNLIYQAVDKKDRFKPVTHKTVQPGDIVLLVDPHLKQSKYPIGRVMKIEKNSLNETVSAYVHKGDTKETVYRHATSLIILIPSEACQSEPDSNESGQGDDKTGNITEALPPRSRSRRAAANRCKQFLQGLSEDGSI